MKRTILSVRARIILVAILAIIVPSIILSYFGLELALQQRDIIEQIHIRTYRDSAQLRTSRIEQRVADLAEEIWHQVESLDSTASLQQRLPAVQDRHRLVEYFFALDAQGQRLFPNPARAPAKRLSSPPRLQSDFEAEQLLAEGDKCWFRQKDVDEALARYRRCKASALSINTRARATYSIATGLFVKGEMTEAVAEYRELVTAEAVRDAVPSLVALAMYQIPWAHLRAGRKHEAAHGFLALFEALVAETLTLDDAHRDDEHRSAYLRPKIRAQLEELFAQERSLAALRPRYEVARAAERKMERRRKFLDDLQTLVVLKLKVMASENETRQEGFQYMYDDFGSEPHLIAYTVLPSQEEKAPRFLGFKVDLEYVREELIKPIIHGWAKESGAKVALLDRHDSVIWQAREAAAYPIRESFGPRLDFWRLGIAQPEEEALLRSAKNLSIIYASLILIAIAVIIGGVCITVRDMARQLELTKLKSEFISSVSHDLKTPLALIRMFSETLQMGRVRDREKEQEYYRVIAKESERLTHLINNVLDFSRLEAGRKTYELKPVDVAEVVESAVDACNFELTKSGFEVVLNIADDLPEMMLDREAIGQAIINLLNNAVKYSKDTKTVTVQVRRESPDVIIDVVDQGIGVAKEEQARIFDKFYRAPDDHVRETTGSGLGLALVKHAVEAHAGQVAVESAVGEGSRFSIILPVAPRSTLPETTTKARWPWKRSWLSRTSPTC